MGFTVHKSGLVTGKSVREVSDKLVEKIENSTDWSIPNIERFWTKETTDGIREKTVYRYKSSLNQKELIGFEFGTEEACESGDTSGSKRIVLKGCYNMQIKTQSNSVICQTSPITNGVDYKFKCSVVSQGGEAFYTMGMWYAQTDSGGLLIGLYSDDNLPVYSKFPLYFGQVENEYVPGEKLDFVIYMTTGDYPRSGGYSSSTTTKTGHGAGPDNAMSSGYAISNIDLGYFKLFTQHIHIYADFDTYDTQPYTIYYTPLHATFVDKWCPPWHVDQFYAGAPNLGTHPQLLEQMVINDSVFYTVSDDCLGLRVSDSGSTNYDCSIYSGTYK